MLLLSNTKNLQKADLALWWLYNFVGKEEKEVRGEAICRQSQREQARSRNLFHVPKVCEFNK
jgi:hypothetical protein